VNNLKMSSEHEPVSGYIQPDEYRRFIDLYKPQMNGLYVLKLGEGASARIKFGKTQGSMKGRPLEHERSYPEHTKILAICLGNLNAVQLQQLEASLHCALKVLLHKDKLTLENVPAESEAAVLEALRIVASMYEASYATEYLDAKHMKQSLYNAERLGIAIKPIPKQKRDVAAKLSFLDQIAVISACVRNQRNSLPGATVPASAIAKNEEAQSTDAALGGAQAASSRGEAAPAHHGSSRIKREPKVLKIERHSKKETMPNVLVNLDAPIATRTRGARRLALAEAVTAGAPTSVTREKKRARSTQYDAQEPAAAAESAAPKRRPGRPPNAQRTAAAKAAAAKVAVSRRPRGRPPNPPKITAAAAPTEAQAHPALPSNTEATLAPSSMHAAASSTDRAPEGEDAQQSQSRSHGLHGRLHPMTFSVSRIASQGPTAFAQNVRGMSSQLLPEAALPAADEVLQSQEGGRRQSVTARHSPLPVTERVPAATSASAAFGERSAPSNAPRTPRREPSVASTQLDTPSPAPGSTPRAQRHSPQSSEQDASVAPTSIFGSNTPPSSRNITRRRRGQARQ